MAKRNAGSDLNRDNWDEEEEPEEVGSFKRASEEELKRRIIKTVRRRNVGTEEPSKSIFSGFGGFGKTIATNPTSAFAFLANKDKTDSNGNPLTFKEGNNKAPESLPDTTKSSNNTFAKSDNYYSKLKGLNQSVCKWITEHVNENPICILTPIFEDYNTHLKSFDEEKDDKKISTPDIPPFSSTFSAKPQKSPETITKPFPLFSSINSTTDYKPFTFANVTAPKSDETKPEGDDEDQPPKVEFTPVVEENSIYSIKCKVFFKKESEYTDKGVGTLHLKSIENSTNKQLVVRANTNLGNIILNTILMPDVPIERIGKNNVMIFCLPTPESKPPPICVLLRVQNDVQADELSDLLKKYTKK